MGDLKTFWDDSKQAFTGTDQGGAGVTARGSEDIGDNGGDAGLDPMWQNPPVTLDGKDESSNSVSGLPSLPNRYEPTEAPPDQPDLTRRSPGTIDKR